MYQYLSGTLAEKSPTSIVLDVGGVGYQLQIPLSTFSSLPDLQKSFKAWTHLVVREDAHTLYGFAAEDERHLFRLLISVSGIGPKMAITVLSGRSHQELKQAIVEGSLSFLTGITGIGKKTAERIIIELREKIVVEGQAPKGASIHSEKVSDSIIDDSLSALIELGYRKQNAQEAIEKVLKNSKSDKINVSDLIRESLQYI